MICFVISEPPSFVDELTSLEVIKGSAAVFVCKVAGSAPFKVTWFKDKKPVKSSQKYFITDSENVSLKIQDCEVQDIGIYQCVVANEVGSCYGSATLSMKGWFYWCLCITLTFIRHTPLDTFWSYNDVFSLY